MNAKKKLKPFWEMPTSELRQATWKFDNSEYQPAALTQSVEDRAQQRRAMKKIGRSPKGPGKA